MPKREAPRRWADWEKEYLAVAYPGGVSLEEISAELGRTPSACKYTAVHVLYLRRAPDYIEASRDKGRALAAAASRAKAMQRAADAPRAYGSSYGAGITDLERAWRGLPL